MSANNAVNAKFTYHNEHPNRTPKENMKNIKLKNFSEDIDFTRVQNTIDEWEKVKTLRELNGTKGKLDIYNGMPVRYVNDDQVYYIYETKTCIVIVKN